MTNLSLHHDINKGGLRLSATGEIDLDGVELLADAISSAVTSGNYVHVVVDLDQVTFLDSTGITVLRAGKNLADEYGVTYSVANPRDIVRTTLDNAGVLAVLITLPGLDQHRRGPADRHD